MTGVGTTDAKSAETEQSGGKQWGVGGQQRGLHTKQMGQKQKQATAAVLVVVVRRRRLHEWGLGETLVDGVLVVLLCGIGSAQDGRTIAQQQHREIKIKLKADKATRNRSDTDNQH